MKELLETGVSTELGYSGKSDALVGRVKDLSVVIKENNETKSYGCLIWVKKKDSASDNELSSYLAGQLAAKPHIIKNYKATGRGAALALVKYNDPFRNINNIKRFLSDLSDDLKAHDYVNCCYGCGGTEGLGIYRNGNSIVQYCANCRVGEPVTAGDEADAAPAVEESAPVVEEAAPAVEETVAAVEEAAPAVEETAPAVEETAPETREVVFGEEAPGVFTAATDEPETAETEVNEEPAPENVVFGDDRPAAAPAFATVAEEEATPVAETAPGTAASETPAAPVVEVAPEEPAAAAETPAFTASDDVVAAAVEELPEEDEKNELIAAMAEAAAAAAEHELGAESVEDLLADGTETADGEAEDDEHTVISSGDDNVDLSGLMAGDGEDSGEAAPETAEFAPSASAESEVFGNANEYVSEEDDANIDGLMFDAEEAAQKAASEPAFGNANDYIEGESEAAGANIDGLMYDENDAPAPEESISDEDAAAENANIYGLMLGSEQEVADAEEEEVEITEISPLDNAAGKGIELTVNMQEEEDVGIDDDIEVTELYDDSNEGEDIEITVSESEVNLPTDTKGGELQVDETPLEEDGSVPMVNPNSDFARVKQSAAQEKGAVRAFAYGSYENANVAEEPVGFDGRPKGYQGGDPRNGDEMGSISRDYSRQQSAVTAPGAKKPRETGYKVVGSAVVPPDHSGKKGKSSAKTYGVSFGGSNAVLGILAALLFGVIGCALWCGIGYVVGMMTTFEEDVRTIILAACGFLPTLGVFLGYRIGGDCWDVKGVVISGILTVIMDAVGIAAVLVTSELRRSMENYGYNIPFEKAIDNVVAGFSDAATSDAVFRMVGVSAAVMFVSLIIAVVIGKKKS